MTDDWPILSLVTFLPLVGCFFILLTRGDDANVARNSRYIALWTSVPTFLISLLIWVKFDPSTANFQMMESIEWIEGTNIGYRMGVDGISMFFVLLSTVIDPYLYFSQLGGHRTSC